jgi:hypothetical protein
MLNLLSKNHWVVLSILVLLLALLIAATRDAGSHFPNLPRFQNRAGSVSNAIPIAKAEELYSISTFKQLVPSTNAASPFYTTYFQPQPPVKAPTTRKIELTYQGYYQNAGGLKQAFVKVGDKVSIGAVGAKITGDLAVAEISNRLLTLKNSASQTNVLEFNKKKEVEIPAQ